MMSLGIGDKIYFGPEAEFFIFDDVKFSTDAYNVGFKVDSSELPTNSATEYEMGNLGHRPRTKGGYFPVPPIDSCQDIRSEMLSVLTEMGVSVEKHHHEVASAQHELGVKFGPMITMADHMQIYKYVVHQVAQAYGKTATFMPKPVFGDNGSGMHVHQSIWKGGEPMFAGNKYADLSDICLFYIGGILEAREGHQRLHEPADQLLQASGSRLRSPRAARLLGAQPLGLVPHPDRDQPEGQAHRDPLPGSGRQPLPRFRSDADGWPRRHPEQDPSGRPDGQEPRTTCRRPNCRRSRPLRAACAKRSPLSTRTAPSSRQAAS